ncbi:MAG: BamA/TamA family outer membrane protein [Bacteroidetes bacterium]|nr:BamA/TamA family outer membrane protein [Bacteroidota bacterium]
MKRVFNRFSVTWIYKILFTSTCLIIGIGSMAQTHQLVITDITIEGNKRTRDVAITRELVIKKDGAYSSSALQNRLIPRCISNLKNLDLFNQINLELVSGMPINHAGDSLETAVLRIVVVEKWYLWPIPFVEYADRNINEWIASGLDPDRTNYGLYLFKYNLLGLNHTLKLHFIHGYNQAIGLEYRAPWLKGNPKVGLEVKSGLKMNREVWFRTTDNTLEFFQNLNERLIGRYENLLMINIRPVVFNWHQPYVKHTFVHVADTVVADGLNPSFLGDGVTRLNTFQVGYQWFHERRNNKRLPVSGHYHKLDVGVAMLSSGIQYPYASAEIGVLDPFNWLKRSRFSTALYAGMNTRFSTNLPYDQQRLLGYDWYLRGYERYVIGGSAAGVIKSEIRWHVIPERNIPLRYMPMANYKVMPVESFVSFFCDQGYVQNQAERIPNSFENRWLVGYGVGLSTLFYLDKVLRFEYSFNHLGEAGFRLHFHQAI